MVVVVVVKAEQHFTIMFWVDVSALTENRVVFVVSCLNENAGSMFFLLLLFYVVFPIHVCVISLI